jgi:ABC-type nitrate/sulfonate/bicarbonate transport system substrate-binding protein
VKRSHAVRLFGGAAAAGMTRLPAFAQNAPVRIETTPVDSGAEPYYALDMGFFKAAGVEVDLQNGALNGAAISTAVASGASRSPKRTPSTSRSC